VGRKRTSLLAISIAGVLACGASGALPAAADPGASASATRVMVISNCNTAKFKPKSVVIACGDAGLIAKGLTWSSWTGKTAAGGGTGVIETCVPDCASGGTRSGPLELTLSKPTTCSRGVRIFSKVRYTWTSGAPTGPDGKPVGPNSAAIGLGCKLLQK